jgi:dTDP-4-dehydrorhamnose reductase
VEDVVRRERPDWIINCAAYTQVDRAETEPLAAYRVNAVGPVYLASAAREAGACLLHISSDYVFDGRARQPYREEDRAGPLNVYGWSKLAGAQAVRDILPDAHLIVRSQSLFGEGGANFVATIPRLASERPTIQLVSDQQGRSTYAGDLADALWGLIARDVRGTVHCANDGVATWFDVARAAVAAAGLRTTVLPCTTDEMPRPPGARGSVCSTAPGTRRWWARPSVNGRSPWSHT